jgi:hypothetical protein
MAPPAPSLARVIAADADKARQAAVANSDNTDKARQVAEARLNATKTVMGFTISPDTDFNGSVLEGSGAFATNDQCVQRCANMTTCRAFTFFGTTCWLFSNGTFSPRPGFVSGRR